MASFRMKCRNTRCNSETIRNTSKEEFDKTMDGSARQFPCPYCGYPKMMVIITHQRIKDGFVPGWQENIQAYAGGPLEYQRLLRAKGLQEIGKDYIPKESTTAGMDSKVFADACVEAGITEKGSVEYEAIKSGELLKN